MFLGDIAGINRLIKKLQMLIFLKSRFFDEYASINLFSNKSKLIPSLPLKSDVHLNLENFRYAVDSK